MSGMGECLPQAESLINKLQDVELIDGTTLAATQGGKQADRQGERRAWVTSALPEMVLRELQHRGLLGEGASVAMWLLGYVELREARGRTAGFRVMAGSHEHASVQPGTVVALQASGNPMRGVSTPTGGGPPQQPLPHP